MGLPSTPLLHLGKDARGVGRRINFSEFVHDNAFEGQTAHDNFCWVVQALVLV